MGTKMKVAPPDVQLARILESLEQELIDASDAEILDAARSLGMNPEMRGSAAFMGLKFPTKPQLSDFFELVLHHRAQLEAERALETEPQPPKPGGEN